MYQTEAICGSHSKECEETNEYQVHLHSLFCLSTFPLKAKIMVFLPCICVKAYSKAIFVSNLLVHIHDLKLRL